MVQPIQPKYFSETPNTAIDLESGHVVLSSNGKEITGIGNARLDLTDKERVIVEFETAAEGYKIGKDSNLRMKFSFCGQFVPAIAIKSQMNKTGVKL